MTRTIDACAQRGVRSVLDELAVGEVAQTNAAAVSKRIVSGDGELERFGNDRVGSDSVALRPEREVNEREVDLSVGGAPHELRRADVMDPQRHRWVPAVKTGEQPGEVNLTERLDGTDRQVSAQEPADGGNRVPAILGRGHGTPGSRKQRPAGLGQFDLSGAANEQVAAKLALECTN